MLNMIRIYVIRMCRTIDNHVRAERIFRKQRRYWKLMGMHYTRKDHAEGEEIARMADEAYEQALGI